MCCVRNVGKVPRVLSDLLSSNPSGTRWIIVLRGRKGRINLPLCSRQGSWEREQSPGTPAFHAHTPNQSKCYFHKRLISFCFLFSHLRICSPLSSMIITLCTSIPNYFYDENNSSFVILSLLKYLVCETVCDNKFHHQRNISNVRVAKHRTDLSYTGWLFFFSQSHRNILIFTYLIYGYQYKPITPRRSSASRCLIGTILSLSNQEFPDPRGTDQEARTHLIPLCYLNALWFRACWRGWERAPYS